MDTLPNELLVMILEILKEWDINSCPRVCKNWKNVAYNGVGVFRALGPTGLEGFVRMGATGGFHTVRDINEIETIGIQGCALLDVGDADAPEFMKRHLVKCLTLHGPISQPNFNKLVMPLENLQNLTLNLTSLSSFRFEEDNGFTAFSKLKFLKIIGDHRWIERNPTSHNFLSSNILTILLAMEFPQLYNLQLIHFPTLHYHPESPTRKYLKVLDAISIFMLNHSSTLKKFGFLIDSDLQLKIDGPTRLIPDVAFTNQLQFHTFDLHHLRWNSLCYNDFDRIIESQTSLRHFMSAAWNPNFSPRLVTQNSTTLVTLEIFFNVHPWTVMTDMVIDCAVFTECFALKSLTLVARNLTDECGKITRTAFIPNSLKSIRFFGFQLNAVDAGDLVTKEWDMLRTLELQYIGTSTDCGVPFYGICQLLALKRVENVQILAGVNIDSLSIADIMWWESFPRMAVSILWSIDHENPDTISELRFRLDGETDKNYVKGHGNPCIPTNHMSVLTVVMHQRKLKDVVIAYP